LSLLISKVSMLWFLHCTSVKVETKLQPLKVTIPQARLQSCLILCLIHLIGMCYPFCLVHYSYSLCSTSGAGDHGEQGIKTFLDQHQCVQKCTQMGLKELGDLEDEDEQWILKVRRDISTIGRIPSK
jgi:hypothetical protein